MKKVLLTVLAGAFAALPFVPALAADDEKPMFDFNGEVRARYEYLNNYIDLRNNTGSSATNDDKISIAPYRVMLGITGNFAKNVSAHVDLQYTGHFGDEFNPSKDNIFFMNFPGPVGQGDAPYQLATQGVQLYQGYIDVAKIGGSDFGLRIGRQEHTYGTELFMGDNDFYSGLSFDGARGMWQHGASDLNFFYYKIAEENCFSGVCSNTFVAGPFGSNDSNLFGATYDWNFKTMGTVGGYVLAAQDLGGDGPIFFPDSKLITYGARYNRGMMNGNNLNMLDWNIEVALQSGDEGGPFGGPKTKLKGWIGEGWFAGNFHTGGNSHGRAHIGILMTSGDKLGAGSPDDENFKPLYGDFHANNRFGDLDWVDQFGPQNLTDYNVGYEQWIGDHYLMFAYHMFKETESNTATLGAHENKIGDEIDLKYVYKYSKNLAMEVLLGEAMPNKDYAQFFGLIPPGTSTDPVQRAYIQAHLTW